MERMNRFSNTVLGFLNLLTLISSLPIIGAGLWLSRSTTTCQSFLQTPLLLLGFTILVISLAGFLGSCFNISWALWVYLVVMLCLIASFIIITLFGFIVTGRGGGVLVPGRNYREYKLKDYSAWLRGKVGDAQYWDTITRCMLGSRVCGKVVSWTPLDYLSNNMAPVQSGCCKPPTSCNYDMGNVVPQESDCYKWNNDPTILCYECDSCKAGVLEDIRTKWHKLTVFNVVLVVILVGTYAMAICAHRNLKRSDTGHYDYRYGQNRMSKVRPTWDYNWSRWWHDQRDRLY